MINRPGVLARRTLIVGLLGTGIASGGFYLRRTNEPTPAFRSEPVSRASLVRQVTATGQVAPRIRVEVSSQVSGNVRKVFVDFGAQVRKDQPLAQLDTATYETNVKEARVNLANAKAALANAATTLTNATTTLNGAKGSQALAQRVAEQAQALQAEGLMARADLEKALADVKQAEGAVTIAEGGVKIAREGVTIAEGGVKIAEESVLRANIDLEKCTLRAPIRGVVISRSVNVGQTVAASTSAPVLFVIANDLTKMQIEANVSEADVGAIRPAMESTFTVDAFPDRIFHGTLEQIRSSPTVDQSVVTYPTIIQVDNAGLDLKPGMTANVSIIIERRDEVLTIPNASLRFRPPDAHGPKEERDPTRATIYRLTTPEDPNDAAPAEPVKITLGLSDGRRTEVVEGLDEGDQVVVGTQRARSPEGLLSRIPSFLTGAEDTKKRHDHAHQH